jgi:transposase-like protein
MGLIFPMSGKTVLDPPNAALRAEALHLAGESHSTQSATRALGINPKLLYQWKRVAPAVAVAAASTYESGPDDSETMPVASIRLKRVIS